MRKLRPVEEEASDRKVPMEYEIEALRKINTARELELLELKEDFKNYKKKKEQEIARIRKTAADNIIKDLVTVIDTVSEAYKHSKDKHGLSLLYTKLLNIIKLNGGTITRTTGESPLL